MVSDKEFRTLKYLIISILNLFFLQFSFAQNAEEDSLRRQKRNSRILIGASVAAYVGTLYTLNKVWYADRKQVPFHFFEDMDLWQQIDKFGHAYTACNLSRAGTEIAKSIGFSDKKAAVYGGIVGFVFMSPIEIGDGFAEGYGASKTDLAANFLGAAFYTSQQLIWNEQRIEYKFSYHESSFARQRPEVLGAAFPERLLKDYNAQTYWLCVDLFAFRKKEENRRFHWLGAALGYSADGMLYGSDDFNRRVGSEPRRRFFLAPDFRFKHIRTKRKFLKILFGALDIVKLPAPALEYSPQTGFKFHPIYF